MLDVTWSEPFLCGWIQWGTYGSVGPLQTAEGGGIPGGHRGSRLEPRYRPY
jgi:hypothetical protein